MSEIAGPELEAYNSRRAAYDLSKVRGKGLVERIGKSRRYRTTSDGVGKLGGYTILRDQVIKPLMAGVVRRQGRPPKTIHPVDQHYQNLRVELYDAGQFLPTKNQLRDALALLVCGSAGFRRCLAESSAS